MSATEEHPHLQFVSNNEASVVTDNGVKWLAGVTEDTTGCTEFTFGTGKLDPGARATFTPELEFDEAEDETSIMLTSGTAIVTVDNKEHPVHPFDAVFVPPDADYTFENRSNEPIEFIWGNSSGEKIADLPETQIFDHDGQTQIINTMHDLEPVITLNEGHSKRYWVPICPEVCGAQNMGMGVIQRPPGSVAPLHEHNPPTLTEAFTMAKGQMLITDQDGEEFILDPDDFLYVPEYGMHTNKNISTVEMTYAFIECPARSRDRIAQMEQNWYDSS